MSNQINSLYIHFPYCQHLCNYCDFYKHKLSGENYDITTKNFNSKLIHQLGLVSHLHQENNFHYGDLKTLYLGGGTPSLWGNNGINFLQQELFSQFNFATQPEVTLEVDPGTASADELDQWQKLGVNRFSCGVQSVDNIFLSIFDRFHQLDDVENLLNYFCNQNLNFSVDLLLGAPQVGKAKRDLKWEIDKVLEFKPKHLSVYILHTRKNYPHYNVLPNDADVEKEYFYVAETLQSHGFEHYEVSNFARPGYQSQHNKAYWQMDSVAACGPIGTGFLYDKGHDSAIRYQANAEMKKLSTEILTQNQIALENLYLALRSLRGIQLGSSLGQFNLSQDAESLFTQWAKQGVGQIQNNKFTFNYRGWILLDSFIQQLFPFHLN